MTSTTDTVYALVLAGGAGTRFWPASRRLLPKQLLPLVDGVPLLRRTVERILPLCGAAASTSWARVLIATGEHLADATRALLPELSSAQFLLEPVARNTAPCIAWAAATVARTHPDAVIMVLPSDHHIGDVDRFRAAVSAAIESARRGVITTIGVRPSRPETGFGYIEIEGPPQDGVAQRGIKFVEKPDIERARSYVAGGKHLWNAGMFFFRAKDMLRAVEEHLPALAEGLRALDLAASRGEEAREVAAIFPSLPSISIDHGVMDHLAELAVVPADFGWSDVGSFQSAWELAKKDDAQNAAPPETVLLSAGGNYVLDMRSPSARKRVIALAGVRDLVVIETDDALLVTTREKAQDVKRIVEVLTKRGDTDLV